MKEIEVKIRLPDVCAVPKLVSHLKTLNARQVGVTRERNHIFDLENRFLKGKGCMLRVREGLIGSPSSITFKGPAEESLLSKVKVREEVETEIQNPQAIIRLLRNLGLEVKCTYAKIRQTYELCGAMVQIDEVAGLGYFVEIEDSDERKIKELIRVCRLERFERITKSYPDMVEENSGSKAFRTDL